MKSRIPHRCEQDGEMRETKPGEEAFRSLRLDPGIQPKPKTGTSAHPVALCGVTAALSVALLYIGSFTVFDLSTIIVCALATMLVMVEAGERYAWSMVGAVSVLSLLLLPMKLPAVLYVGIGGVYPILKAHYEQYRAPLAWLFKLSTLDTMLLLAIAISKLLLTAEDPFFDFSWLVVGVGTGFFILYDLALSACVTLYIQKIRHRLGRKNLF